jgi:hypothetical protein
MSVGLIISPRVGLGSLPVPSPGVGIDITSKLCMCQLVCACNAFFRHIKPYMFECWRLMHCLFGVFLIALRATLSGDSNATP